MSFNVLNPKVIISTPLDPFVTLWRIRSIVLQGAVYSFSFVLVGSDNDNVVGDLVQQVVSV